MTIRLLVADDQHLVRGALVALLNLEADLEVVADCSDGRDVATLVRDHAVDVALLDIEMPHCNGIDAASSIHDQGLACQTIIVTTFGRPGYVKRALACGVSGFLNKDTPPELLADSIRKVHHGLRVIDPDLAQECLFIPDSPLTDQEVRVTQLILKGKDTSHIALELCLSEGTVRNHISSVIAKTNADHRHEAARIARDYGWI